MKIKKINFIIYLFIKSREDSNLNFKSGLEKGNNMKLIWKKTRRLTNHVLLTPEFSLIHMLIHSSTMMCHVRDWWGSIPPKERHLFWVSDELNNFLLIKIVIFYAMRYTALRSTGTLTITADFDEIMNDFNNISTKGDLHSTKNMNMALFDVYSMQNHEDEKMWIELHEIFMVKPF